MWTTRPNHTPGGSPAIWGSASLIRFPLDDDTRELVLVPVASNEETFATTEQQPCCFARGSLAALDPDGSVVWQYFTISEDDAERGAAGASTWTIPVYDEDLICEYRQQFREHRRRRTRHH